MGSEESAGEEVGRDGKENVEMDVWSCKDERNITYENLIITGPMKVGEIFKKKLKWYGHVMRIDEKYVARVMMMEVRVG